MPIVTRPYGLGGTIDQRKTNWDAWVAGINPEHYWSMRPVDDPHFSNVTLLLSLDGADAATSTTDESTQAHAITFNGNAQLDTAQSPFGPSSLLLDGLGDYLSIPNHVSLFPESGSFTVECHVRWNGDPGGTSADWSSFVNAWNDAFQKSWWVGWRGNALQAFYSNNGTSGFFLVNVPFNPAGDTWYHIAFVMDRSLPTHETRVYVDGVQVGSSDTTLNGAVFATTTSEIRVGGYALDALDEMDGWIDNVRITKGVARYSANFTPPAAPYTDPVAGLDEGSSTTLLDMTLVNGNFSFGVEGPFGTDPDCTALEMTDNVIDAAAFVQNGTNMWTTGGTLEGQLTFHLQRFDEGVSLNPFFQYEGLLNGTNEMRVNVNSTGLVQTFLRPSANNNAFQQSPNGSFPDDTAWHMVSVIGDSGADFRKMLIDGYLIPQKNSTSGDSNSWFGEGQTSSGWYHSLTRNRYGPSPGSTTLSSPELGTHRVANFLIDDVEPSLATIQAGYSAFSGQSANTYRHLMTALDPAAWWQMYDHTTTGGLAECIQQDQVPATLEGTPTPLATSAFASGDDRPGSMSFSDDGFYTQGTSIGGNFGTSGSIIALFKVTDNTNHRTLLHVSNTGAVVRSGFSVLATSGFLRLTMSVGGAGVDIYDSDLQINVADGSWHFVIATQNHDSNGIVWYLDGTKYVATDTEVVESLAGPATVNYWFDDVVASGVASPNGFGIGVIPSNPRLWHFFGEIQDVLVTQTQVNDAQAAALWNSFTLV
jgi:hypothetical protein